MYKCVHEHELTKNKERKEIYEEEGHNTRIMSAGLTTWPSHHLPFRVSSSSTSPISSLSLAFFLDSRTL